MSNYVAHETAVIDSGAAIGPATKIWHFSHVMGGAEIGEQCTLGQNVFIADGVRVGNRVKIQNNVSLYQGVVLEDDTFCGPSSVFTNVKTPRASFPRNTASDYLTTVVKRGASIGANATILCGLTIGEWAFVAAGSVVTKDVPSFGLFVGVPGKLVGWVCECGVPLPDIRPEATCGDCRRSYRQDSADGIERTS